MDGDRVFFRLSVLLPLGIFFGIIYFTQHIDGTGVISERFCGVSTKHNIFPSACVNCWQNRKMRCPGRARKLTRGQGKRGCRYDVEVGDGTRKARGCSHLCREAIVTTTCCDGYWGRDCQSCPKDTTGLVCGNRGQCFDGYNGNGTCDCGENLSGSFCEICSKPQFYGPTCRSVCACVHGTCDNGINGTGVCDCESGFGGELCEQKLEACASITCQGNSTCQGVVGRVACVCSRGYTGDGNVCSEINPCEAGTNAPCSENATCAHTGPDQSTCSCKEGFSGDGNWCEAIDPCQTNNGGCNSTSSTCNFDGPGQSSCECKSGFQMISGECQLVDICGLYPSTTCADEATCQTILAAGTITVKCTCPEGMFEFSRLCYDDLLSELYKLNATGRFANQLNNAVKLFEVIVGIDLYNPYPWTLFVPVDSAFTENLGTVMINDYWRTIGRAHIVSGSIHVDLNSSSAKTMYPLLGHNYPITFLRPGAIANSNPDGGNDSYFADIRYMQNSFAKVLVDAQPALNGIMYIIDTVIRDFKMEEFFPKGLGMEVLRSFDSLSNFTDLASRSGLLVMRMNSPIPFMLFAPNNEAMAELSDDDLNFLKSPQGVIILNDILNYNIAPGANIIPSYQLATRSLITTSQPIAVNQSADDGTIWLGGEKAKLVQSDIVFNTSSSSSGYIQIVDKFLIPPTMKPLVKNRCQETVPQTIRGPCGTCERTFCKPGGLPQSDEFSQKKICIYTAQVESDYGPTQFESRQGCNRLCSHTSNISICCPGFYGTECRSCPGAPNNACNGHGICADTERGAGLCTCNSGFEGESCNICSNRTKFGPYCDQDCSCQHGVCKNTIDSHGECIARSCEESWSGPNCDRKIEICVNGTLTCHQFANCIVSESGNASCVCEAGYTGSGYSCDPYDPCINHNEDYPCSLFAYCSNLGRGNVSCQCFPSYKGDGKICSPVDNCESVDNGGCSQYAKCYYEGPGKHSCVCNEGYRGDGYTCSEIDVCQEDNGGCDIRSSCEKTGPGTRRCTCFPGYDSIGTVCVGNILQEIAIRSDLTQIHSWVTRWRSIKSLLMNLEEGFTCFFPTDSAWRDLSWDDRNFWLSEEHLSYILKRHIVPKYMETSTLIARKGQSVTSLLDTVEIYIRGDTSELTDKNVGTNSTERSNLPIIGKSVIAKLLDPDIPVSRHGIIHIIDSVLLPPKDVVTDYPSLTTMLQTGTGLEKYGKFVNYLNSTGAITLLETSDSPYTLFLAPDSAVTAANLSTSTFNVTVYSHLILGKLIRYFSVKSGEHISPYAGPSYILTIVRHHESLLVNGLSVMEVANRTDRGIVYRLTDDILMPQKTRCDNVTSTQLLSHCLPCHFPSFCPVSSKLFMETHCLFLHMTTGGALKTRTGCQWRCIKEVAVPRCCPGFYGDGCDPCPGGAGNVCFKSGTCSDGLAGNGSCTCSNPKYSGTACETCADRRYGITCDNVCQCQKGMCNDGIDGDGSCTCDKGYTGVNCDQPIDPSNSCNNTCHTAANCVPAIVGPGTRCVCSFGYKGDGTDCQPVNPCKDPDINPGCHENAICLMVSAGIHNCTCKPNYEGDGRYCSPVNPCFKSYGKKCDDNANCYMVAPNVSRCVCKEFFEGDGKSCSQVDLCRKDNGGCSENAICTPGELPGKRDCTCKNDYYGNGFNCTGSIYSYISGRPRFNWFYLMDMFASLMPHILSEGNHIVAFLPSQAIMTSLNSTWLNYEEPATQLYLSHIVGCFNKKNLTGVSKIRTLAGDVLDVTQTESGFVINNTINVLSDPLEFWNGLLYEIDQPIVPSSMSRVFNKAEPTKLVKILQPYMENGMDKTSPLYKNTKVLLDNGFQWIVTLLETAGELETLQYPLHNPWMLLLPNEEAFRLQTSQRLRSFMNLDDPTFASEYIRYHMIREAFISPASLMVEQGQYDLRTMQGSKISIQCAASSDVYGQISVNNGMANVVGIGVLHFVTQTGQEKKSAIYVLDKVLDPPSIGGRCDVEKNAERQTPCALCLSSDLTCPVNTTLVSRDDCSLAIPGSGSDSAVNVPGCSITCSSYEKIHNCCPHYYGHSCHACPGGANSPCSGNGKCNDGVNGTGTCQCKSGFIGTACERCDTGRYGRNCLMCQCTMYGHCNEGINGDGSCFCDRGWTGAKCAQKRNSNTTCNPPCHKNGYCLDSGICYCKPGYGGNGVDDCAFLRMCQVDNGGCSPYASCEYQGDQVHCKCRPNFVGDGYYCEPYDPCTTLTSTCHSMATCVVNSQSNSSKCVCKPGYDGDGVKTCAKRKAKTCNVNNGGCSGRAKCTDIPRTVAGALPTTSCKCNSGFIGDGLTCHGSVMSIIRESFEMRNFFDQLRRLPGAFKRKLNSLSMNYTVFVPRQLPRARRPTYAVKRHIVQGRSLYFKQLLNVNSLSVKPKPDLPVQVFNGDEIYVNSRRIQKSDIIGTNGVIHIIDKFLPSTKKLVTVGPTTAPSTRKIITPKKTTATKSKTVTTKPTVPKTKKTVMTTKPKIPIDRSLTTKATKTISKPPSSEMSTTKSTGSTSVGATVGKTVKGESTSNAKVVVPIVVLLMVLVIAGGVGYYWWKRRHSGGFSLFRERSGYEEPEGEAFDGLTNPAYDSTGFNTTDNDDIILRDVDEETALAMKD